jgi:V/A-type H+/Na+-transporting ATPase subunit I
MQQVNMIVFDTDIDAVTEEIIKLEILHLVDIVQIAPWTQDLKSVKLEEAMNKYSQLSKRLHDISKRLGITDKFVTVQKKAKPANLDEIEKALDKMEAGLMPLIFERDIRSEEMKSQQKIFNQVKILTPPDFSLDPRAKYSFLEMVTGRIPEKNLPIIKKELEPVPNVIMPFGVVEGKAMVFLIVLKKDRAVLEKAMKEGSAEKVEIPEEATRLAGDVQKKIKEKIVELQKQVHDIELKIQDKRDEFFPDLLGFLKFIHAKQILAKAKFYFKRTEHTYLISGWVPRDKKRPLIEGVQWLTRGNCYIEEMEAEKLEAVKQGKVSVPVQFNNSAFFKPFELLTSIFGMPEYNVIDPTIFLAITFLIMFGAMFGDVGHGLVLVLLGASLTRQKKPAVIKAGALSFYCGVSSIVFGILYGSYFGLEDLFAPLWMNPMHNIMYFIGLAMFWGVGIISIGIIINLINAFKKRDLAKGLFDKAGLVGGLIYWGAVGLAIKFFIAKEAGLKPVSIVVVIGTPVLLLFLKGPILKFFRPGEKAFPDGFLSYILDTVVELVEIFIGYLANTVSFIRVAAFALAHAGLFIAVFSLADIVKDAHGGMFYSTVILILGNVLIIALEGLIVTIQGLRLEYYEFFSRFFAGEGKEYKPVKMK